MDTPGRTLLYYPSIEIPSGSWLRQAVLYWDQLGSVVPQLYDDEVDYEHRYNRDIRQLHDAGMFRPFNPDELMWAPRAPPLRSEFEQEFKSALELMPALAHRNRRVRNERLGLRKEDCEQIYAQKVTRNLFDWLYDRSLAIPMLGDEAVERCLLMEKRTYRIYMCLLAKYLAKLDDDYVSTGTDDNLFLRLNYALAAKGVERELCINSTIKKVLVAPAPDTPIAEILQFRKKHLNQLLEFRRKIDEYHAALSGKTPEDAKVLTATLYDNIRKDSEALKKASRFPLLRNALGAVQAFSRITVPAAWAGVGVAVGAGPTVTALPWKWLEIGIGAAATVNLAVHFMTPGKDTSAERPFTYVYSANRRFARKI